MMYNDKGKEPRATWRKRLHNLPRFEPGISVTCVFHCIPKCRVLSENIEGKIHVFYLYNFLAVKRHGAKYALCNLVFPYVKPIEFSAQSMADFNCAAHY